VDDKLGFPSAACHVDEHDAVLRSVHEVQSLVAAGERRVARALAFELTRWFPSTPMRWTAVSPNG